MVDRTVITEQLATMGELLPDWPAEAKDDGPTICWILQGQAYAEGLRLWRAQLRNEAALDGMGGVLLTAVEQKLGSGSNWDQGVARYLLAGPKDGGNSERTLAAAKLVAANDGTKAQQLGCALELARDGLLVCALEAITQLVAAQQVSADECLDIIALLVANLPEAACHPAQGPNVADELWLQNVALHLHACSVLASAASKCSGEQDRTELLNQLEAMATLATNKRLGQESDEHVAIQQAMAQERVRKRICILLKEKEWLEALAELELLPKAPNADRSLHNELKNAVLSAFADVAPEYAPADYATVNQLREEQGAPWIEQWKGCMDVLASLNKATPLALIKNFAAARGRLKDQSFWIAYGNTRTGSTMVFNLLRILANSLSRGVISAWEGDFASPEKFFQLIDESDGISLGVLKIHRSDNYVNARLASRQAAAILSCRDMAGACFSYWRMLNNPRSPFFNGVPRLAELDRFVESEIENFQIKSMQPNTLIVRERDLRSHTLESIRDIAGFVGIELADETLEYLSDFLSPEGMCLLTEKNLAEVNSTGHEAMTYLHPDHVAKSSSEQQCPENVREYIKALIRKNHAALDHNGYCKVADEVD